MKQTFSKITDIYSRYCNVSPKDFVIPENYYPLPFDKYICISSYASAESMKYDFYRDIIEDLKEDYDIVQIGKTGDEILPGAYHCFTEDDAHLSYIIANSKGLIANDSYLFYLAKYNDIPHVVLFGPSLASCSFFDMKGSVLLEPERPFTASYSRNESPKSINEIPVEKVINSVYELLGQKKKSNKKTVYVGSSYSRKAFEIVPNHITPLKYSPNYDFIIRMDIDDSLEFLVENLKRLKSEIITQNPIPSKILKACRSQITRVTYSIDAESKIDFKFIKTLESLGIEYLFSLEKRAKLYEIKLKVIDCKGKVVKKEQNKKPFPVDKKKKYVLKSNKKLVSKEGVFVNEYFYNKKEKLASNECFISNKDLNNKLFLKDLEYYKIDEIDETK